MSREPVFNPAPNEQELIRWGDRTSLLLPVTEIFPVLSVQLVKVHRHIPESWKVCLFAFIRDTAAVGANYDVTVSYDLIVGSGSTQINLQPTIRMHIVGGAPTPSVQDYNTLVTSRPMGFLLFDIPACDIQVQVVQAINNGSPAVTVDVAALAAPRYSPPTPGPQGGPHADTGHQEMSAPFWPEELRYR